MRSNLIHLLNDGSRMSSIADATCAPTDLVYRDYLHGSNVVQLEISGRHVAKSIP
jgi:hypothetical protein